MEIELTLEKLVFGGEALGTHEGLKVFVWGALPGERARVRLTEKKRNFARGVAVEILQPKQNRQAPRDPHYLSCSPWQILPFDEEQHWKQAVVREVFEQIGKISLPDFSVQTDNVQFGYRNNMEYVFTARDGRLVPAFYHRGTVHRYAAEPCALATPAVNRTLIRLLGVLNARHIPPHLLKSIIIKSNSAGESVAGIFVTSDDLPALPLADLISDGLRGIKIFYSDPRSPASIAHGDIATYGVPELTETINHQTFVFGITSFFQINIPVFELALQRMRAILQPDSNLLDLYAGVGAIGFSLSDRARSIRAVEIEPSAVAFAERNATANHFTSVEIISSPAERALDYVAADRITILDPPRAGLHPQLIRRILDVLPPRLIYLSCNPSTQARDLALLLPAYRLTSFDAFNFFPRTPHVETLAVLEKK